MEYDYEDYESKYKPQPKAVKVRPQAKLTPKVRTPKVRTPSSVKSEPSILKAKGFARSWDDGETQAAPSPLTLLVCGHVDAGKSTLVGQLLVSLDALSNSRKFLGCPEMITDELEDERQRCITLDVAIKHAKLPSGVWLQLVDTPGHADLNSEMECGASLAEDGLLFVIDATDFLRTVDSIRERLRLIFTPGISGYNFPISTIIFIINKIDMESEKMNRTELRQALDSIVEEIWVSDLWNEARKPKVETVFISARSGSNILTSVCPDERSLVQIIQSIKPSSHLSSNFEAKIIDTDLTTGSATIQVRSGSLYDKLKVISWPTGTPCVISTWRDISEQKNNSVHAKMIDVRPRGRPSAGEVVKVSLSVSLSPGDWISTSETRPTAISVTLSSEANVAIFPGCYVALRSAGLERETIVIGISNGRRLGPGQTDTVKFTDQIYIGNGTAAVKVGGVVVGVARHL